MKAQTLELLAMSISEINGAFSPGTESFLFKNPGKLRSGNMLRTFTTVAGGLKSLISELSRYPEDNSILAVARNYGCKNIESELLLLDYLTRSIGKTVEQNFTLRDLEQDAQKEE